MSSQRKTAIVTVASQGIGAGVVNAFLEREYNVVANSRKITRSTEVRASNHVALVDGDIGEPATAGRVVETTLARFQKIDVLVNNAGISKPFTDYTADDFRSPVAANIEGFLYVTQLVVKQFLFARVLPFEFSSQPDRRAELRQPMAGGRLPVAANI